MPTLDEWVAGVDRRGRPLDRVKCDKYRAHHARREHVLAIRRVMQPTTRTKPEKETTRPAARRASPPSVSAIGDRLATIIQDEVGVLPCGTCKAEMLRLNSMTAEQVQADRAAIIARIYANLKEVALPVATRLAVIADAKLGAGQVHRWIGVYLDLACE